MDEFTKGKRPSASTLNEMSRVLNKWGNLYGDNLDITAGSSGMTIRASAPERIFAKITSGSNPYAWTEQVMTAGGTWATPTGARTGTTSNNPAYEVNNVVVPVNKIVQLEPGVSGEWLFQFLKNGSATPTGPCVQCIHVKGCKTFFNDGGPYPDLAGATVTWTSGYTTGTCTTNSVGTCCVAFYYADVHSTYTVTVSADGYISQTFTVTCSSGSAQVTLIPNKIKLNITVIGCTDRPVPCATVTASCGGTCSTDVNGKCTMYITPSTTTACTIDATGPRMVSTGPATIGPWSTGATPCSLDITLGLTAATGYQCCQEDDGKAYVIKETLTITIPSLGTGTLTWSGGAWIGCLTGTGFNTITQPDTPGQGCGSISPTVHTQSITAFVKYTCDNVLLVTVNLCQANVGPKKTYWWQAPVTGATSAPGVYYYYSACTSSGLVNPVPVGERPLSNYGSLLTFTSGIDSGNKDICGAFSGTGTISMSVTGTDGTWPSPFNGTWTLTE